MIRDFIIKGQKIEIKIWKKIIGCRKEKYVRKCYWKTIRLITSVLVKLINIRKCLIIVIILTTTINGNALIIATNNY